MKKAFIIAVLLTAPWFHAFGNTIEFDWTASSADSESSTDGAQLVLAGPPDEFFQYSGGTLANGVFTPTGLINSSFGVPRVGVAFGTDTPYGPSFNINGPIEPITYEQINTGYRAIQEEAFQNQSQFFIFADPFPTGTRYTYSGVWTVTGLDVPDTTNSALLLATALGALGVFHGLGRRQSLEVLRE